MGQYPSIREDEFFEKKNDIYQPYLLQMYEKEKEIVNLKIENFLSHTFYILIIIFILSIKSLI